MQNESLIAPEIYHSKERQEAEYGSLWPKSWLLVTFTQDLAVPGDYITFEFGRESFLICHTEKREITAFYNVCPHRGNRLVHDAGGNCKRFVCNYHSWSFGLSGESLRITDRETFRPKVLESCSGLKPLKCEVFGLFVFVNMDEEAPTLLETMGHALRFIEPYHIDQMRLSKDVSCEVNANWKVLADAFTEFYHIHMIHPEALEISDDEGIVELYENGCGKVQIRLAQSSQRIKARKRLSPGKQAMLEQFGGDSSKFADSDLEPDEIRLEVAKLKRRWLSSLGCEFAELEDEQIVDDHLILLFPNVVINVQPDALLFERWVPHPDDPCKCRFDVAVFFIPSRRCFQGITKTISQRF